MVTTITSTRNPTVALLRSLGTKTQERRDRQMMLLEGTHLIVEALETGYPVQHLYCLESWYARHSLPPDLAVTLVSEAVLAAIATTVSPDGVVAIAPYPNLHRPPLGRVGLVLEAIQDPGNAGTIIRTAVAAAAEGIFFSADSVDLTHPKVLRASAGQWFRAPLCPCPDVVALVNHYQQQGLRAIATDATAPTNYWDYDFSQPVLLLLGSEGQGLSAQLLAIADDRIAIPMHPSVESLNVSTSAALILYESLRQRRDATHKER
jgi:TrmH family RNA methyltransferase